MELWGGNKISIMSQDLNVPGPSLSDSDSCINFDKLFFKICRWYRIRLLARLTYVADLA